jgi:hypothetical protein
MLDPLPPRAVLFVGGDNDSYPLWYLQHVEHHRTDVTIVTMPLLGAPWYVAELERRHHLVGANSSGDPMTIARRIAESAFAAHRPVAVSLMVPKADRNRLANAWVAAGVVAIADDGRGSRPTDLDSTWTIIPVSHAPTERARTNIEQWRTGGVVRPSTEPVHEYVFGVLSCPDLALRNSPSKGQLASLDSLCNLR